MHFLRNVSIITMPFSHLRKSIAYYLRCGPYSDLSWNPPNVFYSCSHSNPGPNEAIHYILKITFQKTAAHDLFDHGLGSQYEIGCVDSGHVSLGMMKSLCWREGALQVMKKNTLFTNLIDGQWISAWVFAMMQSWLLREVTCPMVRQLLTLVHNQWIELTRKCIWPP